MISRSLMLCLLSLAALLLAPGCDQGERVGVTAEVDDQGYKRAKELVRQGRKQEALTAFQKVIERRGDDSAESHLEAGLLYADHFKDPIAAIYHFRMCRELKPNSPTAELVKHQINAAMREFARTLPGDPLNNAVVERFNTYDQLEKVQRENETLKAQNATLRLQLSTQMGASGGPKAPGEETTSIAPTREPPRPPGFQSPGTSTIPRITLENPPGRTTAVPTPPPGSTQTFVPASSSRPTAVPPPPAVRRHVVVSGDTASSLSAKYYGGNRSRFKDIYAANRGVMKSPDDVRVGVELVIPP